MADRVYLDHNATTPARSAVVEAVARALASGGNASSVHAEGRAARAMIEAAREAVADLVGANPKNVIFTSGASEAAALALNPNLKRGRNGRRPTRLLINATEHPCVLAGGRFAPEAVRTVDVDAHGRCDLADLTAKLEACAADGAVPMLALQAANNETGVIQPVAEAAALVRATGGYTICDAVQVAGKINFKIIALQADLYLMSAHKIGGSQGVGALVLADDALDLGPALIAGGGQEQGRRAGTENLAGIVGFGIAAREAKAELAGYAAHCRALRDRLETQIRRLAPDAAVFGVDAERLPNTSAFAVPGARAETLLMRLDLDGFAVSSGSACSSGKVKRSHVLAAMGISAELADCALRISLGRSNTQAEIERFVAAFENALRALHVGRGGRHAA